MRKKIEFIGEDSGGFKVLEGTLILHSDLLRGSFEISNNNCNLDNEIHLMDSKSCELRKHENGKYILSPFKIPSGIMYLPQIEDLNIGNSTASLCLHQLKENINYSNDKLVQLINTARYHKLKQQEFKDLYNLVNPEKRSCITLHLQFPNNIYRERYVETNVEMYGK